MPYLNTMLQVQFHTNLHELVLSTEKIKNFSSEIKRIILIF